jgi:glycine betaine/proline transport system substrate-binding protein
VVDYVTARGLDGSIITDMLVWSDDNQATSEDAAVEFLNRYPEIWTTWVTTEAANKITESLQ